MVYRFLRYIANQKNCPSLIFMAHIDIFIYRLVPFCFINGSILIFYFRSICQEGSCDVDREQAFKLIHSIMETKDGCVYLPKSIVSLLVAVAEQQDDQMRLYALLIVAELCKNVKYHVLSLD
jgi:hypothetical protein